MRSRDWFFYMEPTTFSLRFGDRAEEIRAKIQAAIQRAYDTACKPYDPKRGYNTRNFGFCVADFVKYEIEEEFRDFPGFKITTPNNALHVRVGDVVLLWAKLGHVAGDEGTPARFFQSANRRAAAAKNAKQMELFHENAAGEWEDGPGSDPTYLTVGHNGNPRDGLCEIRIGATQPVEDGDPMWIWHEPLWTPPLLAEVPTVDVATEITAFDKLPEADVVVEVDRIEDQDVS